MEQFIGCDAHKKFSVFVAVNEKGQAGEALRVNHERTLYREFLARLPAGSSIAVEASGTYNWLVDEMERLGHHPKLCSPFEAKRRMGLTNKTDKLDARGLAILLRNGTLPEVWIPPSELRDQRELLRMRIFLVRLRTQSQESCPRHVGTLQHSDRGIGHIRRGGSSATHRAVTGTARPQPRGRQTRTGNTRLSGGANQIRRETAGSDYEGKRGGRFAQDLTMHRHHPKYGLDAGNRSGGSVPHRGASSQPTQGWFRRVHSSGGHTRMGQVCSNVNRNLKWAFVETGNLIVINQRRLAGTHVVRLYQRIKRAKNHQKAVVAVGRHLAEAAWWVLTKQEVYREPKGPRQQVLSSTQG